MENLKVNKDVRLRTVQTFPFSKSIHRSFEHHMALNYQRKAIPKRTGSRLTTGDILEQMG